jgi:hypothetical protein
LLRNPPARIPSRRPGSPQGDAGETFTNRGGAASWKSPIDAGSKRYTGPAEYISYGGPEDLTADFVTGSISVGKDAGLVLVSGDPSIHIGDLRHTELVLMDGKMMNADALRAARGFAGRPRFFE